MEQAWITPAVQAAMDRGAIHVRVAVPHASEKDLAAWWYAEYTGSLSLEAFIADYRRKETK